MWDSLPRPFFVLAPLDDVTDVVFREMVAQAGPPHVFFTEFTNVDALFSKGRAATLPRLYFTANQRPIVAQFWGVKPDNFYRAAQLAAELGFDGLDINMGCPDKNVRKAGACSALIDNRPLAAEIIAATKAGAPHLPLSVKTRLGVKTLQTEDWIGWLLEQKLAAITIHARTVLEMSNVPAHWDEVGRAALLRDRHARGTYIIGNGDVMSLAEARERAAQYGVDGVMIGRGIFRNLWFFNPDQDMQRLPAAKRLNLLQKHVELFEHTWGERKNPATMKKFLKMYISDFAGAAALREHLMAAATLPELRALIEARMPQRAKATTITGYGPAL